MQRKEPVFCRFWLNRFWTADWKETVIAEVDKMADAGSVVHSTEKISPQKKKYVDASLILLHLSPNGLHI